MSCSVPRSVSVTARRDQSPARRYVLALLAVHAHDVADVLCR
ncbi:hypothetical protein [Actinopolymorpha rutila]|uniref:Uncharacterized protein n=1 Tax=Actinopolymorpha rutila TaxID=446787 RepID=A0A852Z5A2_9ACTN|nr:hypothetical protein [Actinopolymorpha rutila]NYH87405.1 hypothetical protein [Actinopolymorpha rutila]